MTNDVTSITDASGSKMECSHHIPRRNFTFLVLAPVSSPTYPMRPPPYSPKAQTAPAINPTEEWFIPAELASPPIDPADTTADEIESMLRKSRRSSSVTSVESFGRPRFLKLGPVHFGGEPGVPDFTLIE